MREKPVTADEQYRLIMECRSSGLTDYQWCLEHNIKPGTFYNWVKHLRQKGCADIPSAVGSSRSPVKQEVVKVDLKKPSVPVLEEGEAISESVPYSASVLSGIPVIDCFCQELPSGYHRERMGLSLNRYCGSWGGHYVR